MAFNIKETLATSGLGGVQKALLVIHRNEDASALNTALVTRSTADALKSAAGGLSATSAALKGRGVKASVMQVQYNPSSLTIQANAEAIPFTHLQQNVDSSVPNQSLRPPMVMLSVELTFDAMNPKDAFMAEKFTSISTGGIVSSVAGGIQTAAGKGYTVQPQTEGLIAALLRPSTRLVTFRWADMAFTGQLVEVQADYTMFSVSGKPIRSTVSMNIAQQVESGADADYWENVLNSAIRDGSLEKGKGMDQKLGNVFNLNAF